ncbi:MAG TPA: hypothetical protein VEB23_07195 [Ramlibacter sp.]|nr:hypothetical protein [Ramlibacter sp.]
MTKKRLRALFAFPALAGHMREKIKKRPQALFMGIWKAIARYLQASPLCRLLLRRPSHTAGYGLLPGQGVSSTVDLVSRHAIFGDCGRSSAPLCGLVKADEGSIAQIAECATDSEKFRAFA